MGYKELAAHLGTGEAEARERFGRLAGAGPRAGGLDGDELTSLAEVFGLEGLTLPPDGHVETAKITSGLAKLAGPPPKPDAKKKAGPPRKQKGGRDG